MSTTDLKAKSETGISYAGLRKLNIVAGFAHLTQMFLILFLANDFSLPITAAYVFGPPGTPPNDPVTIFDSRIAWGVALFFALSAFFHFVVASPWYVQATIDPADETGRFVIDNVPPGRYLASVWHKKLKQKGGAAEITVTPGGIVEFNAVITKAKYARKTE